MRWTHSFWTPSPTNVARDPTRAAGRENVYDPFLGSGTTLAAAELTERTCLGLEVDEKYSDVAVQRWQTLAG